MLFKNIKIGDAVFCKNRPFKLYKVIKINRKERKLEIACEFPKYSWHSFSEGEFNESGYIKLESFLV